MAHEKSFSVVSIGNFGRTVTAPAYLYAHNRFILRFGNKLITKVYSLQRYKYLLEEEVLYKNRNKNV